MKEEIQKLKDDLGRLERKKHDYSTVLAGMFNGNTQMREEYTRRQRVFSSVLLELEVLARTGKLDNEYVHATVIKAIEEINNEGIYIIRR